jgi:hypothetical protein
MHAAIYPPEDDTTCIYAQDYIGSRSSNITMPPGGDGVNLPAIPTLIQMYPISSTEEANQEARKRAIEVEFVE